MRESKCAVVILRRSRRILSLKMRFLATLRMTAALAVLTVFPAHAAPPPCAAQVISAVKPYGTASLHKLFFHVYDAAFWTDDANGWNMATPHALHLTYHVSIEKEDLVERTLEELDRNPAVTPAMRAAFGRELPSLYAEINDGDTITAVAIPSKGITFCHNGQVKGVLKDAAMAKPFMGIWLGDTSSEADLRDGLLGKGG
jgi:hypothetical protein